jgi:hypothetical protein
VGDGLAGDQGDAAVKTYRIVTDLTVPDFVAEEEIAQLGRDSATNMRWTLRHEHGSSLELDITHHGVRRLDDAAPVARPTQWVAQQLGPGPGLDR